jgi:transposase
MGQRPIERQVAERFAELVGLGATQHEAARAVRIGLSTGERLLTRPEYRQIAAQAGRERSGVAADLARAIKALLAAEDEAGCPIARLRTKGRNWR